MYGKNEEIDHQTSTDVQQVASEDGRTDQDQVAADVRVEETPVVVLWRHDLEQSERGKKHILLYIRKRGRGPETPPPASGEE